MMTTIETKRLVLRKPINDDWADMRDFFMSARAQYVGGPYTLGRAWRQFSAEVGHWSLLGCGMWAVTEKTYGKLQGFVGAWCPADWPEREIGWVMLERAEGKGFGFEAAQAAIHDVYNRLKWDTAVSYIMHENVRSIALALRLGATLDKHAQRPNSEAYPCLVYRHPKSEVLS